MIMSFLSQLAQTAYPTYSSTYYVDGSEADAGAVLAAFAVMVPFFLFIFAIIYVISSLLLGMIFKKAGEPSWKAWVPIYNSWVLLELGGQKGYWVLLSFVPFLGIVTTIFMYIAMYKIGLRLQKEGWFVLIAIFFPVIWMAWLALDKSTWQTEGSDSTPQTPPPFQPSSAPTVQPTPPAPEPAVSPEAPTPVENQSIEETPTQETPTAEITPGGEIPQQEENKQ